MSEHDNLNIVKYTYLAHRHHKISALLNCLADDVKWFASGPPDIIPSAGTRYGRDQVEQYFAVLEDAEEDLIFEPTEFIAEGDKVVAIGDLQRPIKSTGTLINSPWIHVFTLHKGRISEFRSFYDTAAAIEAMASRRMPSVRSETVETRRPAVI